MQKMLMGLCAFFLLCLIPVKNTYSAQSFSYELDSFPLFATMKYQIKDRPDLGKGSLETQTKMDASYLGFHAGDMTEISVTDPSGQPVLDSRCRNPKSSSRNYNCYSSKFADGQLLFSSYNGANPILNSNLSVGSSGVKSFNLDTIFAELGSESFQQPLHNASSLFLILLRPDFGLSYDGRIFFVTGNEEFYKVRFKVSALSGNTLDVKMDVLNNSQTSGSGTSSFPGRMTFNSSLKKVTSIYLNVRGKEYILNLKN